MREALLSGLSGLSGNIGGTMVIKIFDEILASPGIFDITDIPQDFLALMGFAILRSDVSAVNDDVNVFFNGDTVAANYARTETFSGAIAPTASVASTAQAMACSGDNSPANYFSTIKFWMPFYFDVVHDKQFFSDVVARTTAANMNLIQYTLHWENTDAIDQITVRPDGGGDLFVANSRLTLYGIH